MAVNSVGVAPKSESIIEYARAEGIATIEGQVLRENASMLAMCRELGFDITADPNDVGICIARLTLIR